MRLKVFHMREMARREAVQREIEKQRNVQDNVVLRALVKQAGESRMQMEAEIQFAEAKERKEAVMREEKKVKESLDRYRQMRESMSKALREERIKQER